MYLVAGLGNPDKEYQYNRHNAGFLFLDYLKDKYNLEPFKKNSNYSYNSINFDSEKLILVKPLTYMNLSGYGIMNALSFFKIDINNFIVIYDEAALIFGNIRIREKGSDAGHNGIKNIIQLLGTDLFKRIRIGISKPDNNRMRDYVLSDFSNDEIDKLNKEIFLKVEDSLKLIIKGKIKEAMNLYNAKNNLWYF